MSSIKHIMIIHFILSVAIIIQPLFYTYTVAVTFKIKSIFIKYDGFNIMAQFFIFDVDSYWLEYSYWLILIGLDGRIPYFLRND